MQRAFWFASSFVAIGALCWGTGCTRRQAPPPLPPPTVSVSRPIEKSITDFADFTGRTDAPFSTDIRPRVTGYLVAMPFREGRVTKDQVLFEIDERPYKAALDSAKAAVEVAKAALLEEQAIYDMDLRLKNTNLGSDQRRGRDQAVGQPRRGPGRGGSRQGRRGQRTTELRLVQGAVAHRRDGRPLSADGRQPGQCRHDAADHGSLGRPDVRLLRCRREYDALNSCGGSCCPATRTCGEKGGLFRADGDWPTRRDSRTRAMSTSATTSSMPPRARSPSAGSSTTRPRPPAIGCCGRGCSCAFACPWANRIRLLVSETAFGNDQGQKYLLAVNHQGVVEYRPVKTGPLQEDGLRVIVEGVQPGDRLIVEGLQAVRADMTVKTEEVPMPVLRSRGTVALRAGVGAVTGTLRGGRPLGGFP